MYIYIYNDIYNYIYIYVYHLFEDIHLALYLVSGYTRLAATADRVFSLLPVAIVYSIFCKLSQ